MEPSKKKRLNVFKAITRDFSPQSPQGLDKQPVIISNLIPHTTTQFSLFNSEDGIKPTFSNPRRSESAGNYLQVSIPCEIFSNYSRKFESFGEIVSQEHVPPFIQILYMNSDASLKANNFLQTFDMADTLGYDSSDYLGNFSNSSPLMNISTEESSREEYEERRKPKKRPLDEGEKTFYVININNIKRGDDSRTTIMIKNIPNKYTQKMLLQTIDKKFMGTYDFLYLPIDFKVNFI